MKIPITVFQALTLLAKKYHDDPKGQHIYRKIMAFYLSGVRGINHANELDNLLDDEVLAVYSVSSDKKDINEDPVRRYFESHLCHQTLLTSLDLLDINLLENHFFAIVNRTPYEDKLSFIYSMESPYPPTIPNEYSTALYHLSRSDSYQSFKPITGSGRTSPEAILNDRKKKMGLIAKSMWAAMHVSEESEGGLRLLNLYNQQGSAFAPIHRGRISREDPDTGESQRVQAYPLGIMRSYMPLPKNDALFADSQSTYTRPADKHTYANGSFQIPNQIFATKVTPFVGSVSGTMLIKLRVIAQLVRNNQFVYKKQGKMGAVNTRQLSQYLKSFIAYMIYNAGGHSLAEYLNVLHIKTVRDEFSSLPGFRYFTLDSLFKSDNTVPFNEAVKLTLIYNDNILAKKVLHHELMLKYCIHALINKQLKPLSPSSIALHAPLVTASHTEHGAVTMYIPDENNQYSIRDNSIVGGALLFALVRMLNEKPLAPSKPDDLIQRSKRLFLVICMVTIAKLVGAKILKDKQNNQITPPKAASSEGVSRLLATTTSAILMYSIFCEPKVKLASFDKRQGRCLQKKEALWFPNT